MPTLPTPVLSVAPDALSQLEGTDALSGLWAVITKAKVSLANGHRLENLSWRLWNKQMRDSHPQLALLYDDKQADAHKNAYRPPTPPEHDQQPPSDGPAQLEQESVPGPSSPRPPSPAQNPSPSTHRRPASVHGSLTQPPAQPTEKRRSSFFAGSTPKPVGVGKIICDILATGPGPSSMYPPSQPHPSAFGTTPGAGGNNSARAPRSLWTGLPDLGNPATAQLNASLWPSPELPASICPPSCECGRRRRPAAPAAEPPVLPQIPIPDSNAASGSQLPTPGAEIDDCTSMATLLASNQAHSLDTTVTTTPTKKSAKRVTAPPSPSLSDSYVRAHPEALLEAQEGLALQMNVLGESLSRADPAAHQSQGDASVRAVASLYSNATRMAVTSDSTTTTTTTTTTSTTVTISTATTIPTAPALAVPTPMTPPPPPKLVIVNPTPGPTPQPTPPTTPMLFGGAPSGKPGTSRHTYTLHDHTTPQQQQQWLLPPGAPSRSGRRAATGVSGLAVENGSAGVDAASVKQQQQQQPTQTQSQPLLVDVPHLSLGPPTLSSPSAAFLSAAPGLRLGATSNIVPAFDSDSLVEELMAEEEALMAAEAEAQQQAAMLGSGYTLSASPVSQPPSPLTPTDDPSVVDSQQQQQRAHGHKPNSSITSIGSVNSVNSVASAKSTKSAGAAPSKATVTRSAPLRRSHSGSAVALAPLTASSSKPRAAGKSKASKVVGKAGKRAATVGGSRSRSRGREAGLVGLAAAVVGAMTTVEPSPPPPPPPRRTVSVQGFHALQRTLSHEDVAEVSEEDGDVTTTDIDSDEPDVDPKKRRAAQARKQQEEEAAAAAKRQREIEEAKAEEEQRIYLRMREEEAERRRKEAERQRVLEEEEALRMRQVIEQEARRRAMEEEAERERERERERRAVEEKEKEARRAYEYEVARRRQQMQMQQYAQQQAIQQQQQAQQLQQQQQQNVVIPPALPQQQISLQHLQALQQLGQRPLPPHLRGDQQNQKQAATMLPSEKLRADARVWEIQMQTEQKKRGAAGGGTSKFNLGGGSSHSDDGSISNIASKSGESGESEVVGVVGAQQHGATEAEVVAQMHAQQQHQARAEQQQQTEIARLQEIQRQQELHRQQEIQRHQEVLRQHQEQEAKRKANNAAMLGNLGLPTNNVAQLANLGRRPVPDAAMLTAALQAEAERAEREAKEEEEAARVRAAEKEQRRRQQEAQVLKSRAQSQKELVSSSGGKGKGGKGKEKSVSAAQLTSLASMLLPGANKKTIVLATSESEYTTETDEDEDDSWESEDAVESEVSRKQASSQRQQQAQQQLQHQAQQAPPLQAHHRRHSQATDVSAGPPAPAPAPPPLTRNNTSHGLAQRPNFYRTSSNTAGGNNKVPLTKRELARRQALDVERAAAQLRWEEQERQRQKEMFMKKPTSSYSNLTHLSKGYQSANGIADGEKGPVTAPATGGSGKAGGANPHPPPQRTQSVGGLSMLMNPDPTIFPEGHWYRKKVMSSGAIPTLATTSGPAANGGGAGGAPARTEAGPPRRGFGFAPMTTIKPTGSQGGQQPQRPGPTPMQQPGQGRAGPTLEQLLSKQFVEQEKEEKQRAEKQEEVPPAQPQPQPQPKKSVAPARDARVQPPPVAPPVAPAPAPDVAPTAQPADLGLGKSGQPPQRHHRRQTSQSSQASSRRGPSSLMPRALGIRGLGLQPSKSSAALPIESVVSVVPKESKGSNADSMKAVDAAVVAAASLNAQKEAGSGRGVNGNGGTTAAAADGKRPRVVSPLTKRHSLQVIPSASASAGPSQPYKPRGPPQGQDMDSDSDSDGEDKENEVMMSKSLAQRRLEIFALRTGTKEGEKGKGKEKEKAKVEPNVLEDRQQHPQQQQEEATKEKEKEKRLKRVTSDSDLVAEIAYAGAPGLPQQYYQPQQHLANGVPRWEGQQQGPDGARTRAPAAPPAPPQAANQAEGRQGRAPGPRQAGLPRPEHAAPSQPVGQQPQRQQEGHRQGPRGFGDDMGRRGPMPVPIPAAAPWPYHLPHAGSPTTPRTTRKLMLRNEMTESFRKQLLWERQQQNAGIRKTANGDDVSEQGAWTSPAMVQLHPRAPGNTGVGAEREIEGAVPPPAATEEELEERRRRAYARNRSWADNYHFKGW